jgi:hypothetical protein
MRDQTFLVANPVMEVVSVEAEPFLEINLSSFIKLNRPGVKAESFMIKGNKYIFHLTESSTFLYVTCDFKAIRASDMVIIDCVKDGVQCVSHIGSMFSYVYENFDWINFKSFSRREKCDIYLVSV